MPTLEFVVDTRFGYQHVLTIRAGCEQAKKGQPGETIWREESLVSAIVVAGAHSFRIRSGLTAICILRSVTGDAQPKWREMGAEERSKAYSPTSVIPEGLDPHIADYVAKSNEAYLAHPDVQTIAYGPKDSTTVDFVPLPSDSLTPLHVYIHGGYWQLLSKRESFFGATGSLARGMAFASVDYTLAPHATLDEIVGECVAAITRLVDDAEMLGIDPARVVVSGSSAGAHLAAMSCLRLPKSHRPAGAVLVSGVYELEPLIGTYINDAVGMDLAVARRNSPALHNLAEFPPSIVTWGENETEEFKRQARWFAGRLAHNNRPVELLEIAGRNHLNVVHYIAGPTTLGDLLSTLAGLPKAM